MRESLVRFRHLLQVLAALDRGADAVARVEELAGQALGHRLLPPLAGVADDPADRERGRPAGPDLDGHLVRGAADAPALDLELGPDVLDRALQHRDGVAVASCG